MNGYNLVTLMIIISLTSCIMPTLDARLASLDKQADERIEQLKNSGRN